VLTVTVFVERVSPVENVSGTSYAEAAVKAAVPSVPPVPMLRVDPSVPARVREFETDKALPEVVMSPRYALFQLPAVVGVATAAVKVAEVPPARMVMVLAAEDWTVTAPVLWLTIV
jgi:hypothetical protein